VTGDSFRRIVATFSPLLEALGFLQSQLQVSGRHYFAEFRSSEHGVGISFEPGENYLAIYVFELKGAGPATLADVDSAIQLSELNRRFQSKITLTQRATSAALIKSVECDDNQESRLLRAAAALLEVLPLYVEGRQSRL
jgi:hypothetical protein